MFCLLALFSNGAPQQELLRVFLSLRSCFVHDLGEDRVLLNECGNLVQQKEWTREKRPQEPLSRTVAPSEETDVAAPNGNLKFCSHL